MTLTRGIEMAAAVIAATAGTMGRDVHAAVAPRVDAVAEAVMPGLGALEPAQRQTILGILLSVFRQASDLVEHPERSPGWGYEEPVVLEATGRASMAVISAIAQSLPSLDGLTERLAGGGAVCDVGTGVGWLAVAAARAWPETRVVGIDILGSALEVAARNLVQSGLSDRVEVRHVDVRDLAHPEFDLVWFPGMFIDEAVAGDALTGAGRALLPGGWIVFGMYGSDDDDSVGARLGDLRSVRSGGGAWSVEVAARALDQAGFTDVHQLERRWQAPIHLVAGRRH